MLAQYGAGPKLQGLLVECWLHQEVVTSPERIPWPTFMSDPKDHTGGTGLSNTLKFESGQCG